MMLLADSASDAMMNAPWRSPHTLIGRRHFDPKIRLRFRATLLACGRQLRGLTDLLMSPRQAYDYMGGAQPCSSFSTVSLHFPVVTTVAPQESLQVSTRMCPSLTGTGDVSTVDKNKASPIVPTKVKDSTDRMVPINLR